MVTLGETFLSLIHSLRTIYRYVRILSLDVVGGALASGAMVVRLVGEPMPWMWWVALPLSVWVIYTTDHLLDAYRLKGRASTLRHRFHHMHFRAIGLIWALGLLSCLSWIPWLAPLRLLWFGLGMGGLVLLHLALVFWVKDRISLLLIKELGVGGIYSLGVWGGPLLLHPAQWPPGIGWLFGQFFLLAMINLLLFSMYEYEIDERDGHTSFVRAIGRGGTRKLILGLGCLVMLFGVLAQSEAPWRWAVQGVMLAMLLVLWLVSFVPQWFAPRERYRIWGDVVFLFPGLLCWL